VTQKWRGSSDSKIGQNIKDFVNLDEKYPIVPDQNWLDMIKSINDQQLIDDNNISFSLCKTLVYHIYCSHSLMGPSNSKIDIDHIIPQSLFESSGIIQNATNIKNSLFNLCPLPSRDNIKKTNKILSKIEDPWLIQKIEKYSLLNQNKFKEYSDVNSWKKLRTKRRSFFEEDFIIKKTKILN